MQRRMLCLTRRDLDNLEGIYQAFLVAGKRKPSASLIMGAALKLLRAYAREHGAPELNNAGWR